MNKVIFVLLAFGFFVTYVTTSPAKIRDTENISVSLESSEKDESSLEGRIKALKEKVNVLVVQGKENEEAFNRMQTKIEEMKSKVKLMTEKLKKINKTDYLKTDVETIKNL